MATLHLICGLPCSGKTTLAKQLEQQHAALRLTTDNGYGFFKHQQGKN
jgi:predicted kinase